ncbi:MAG: hypothetical protein WCI89_01860 [bacterium]
MAQDPRLYAKKIKVLLSPTERALFQKLSTPHKAQDFLDHSPINFQERGEGIFSPRVMLKKKKLQCMEGALVAAATLAYHGRSPLLMDFQTIDEDEDHVIALFFEERADKKTGRKITLWGALSKTNHAILRWRDPVYKTPRELAMSYFHEYYMRDGRKSLLTYSKPFDLSRYAPERWVTAEPGQNGVSDGEDLEWLAVALDESPHFPIFPGATKQTLQKLRRASPLELKLLDTVEWNDPRKKSERLG